MVVGGSTAAVAAAVAAAKQGVRVFLAAPRHYLGEDMAGTLDCGSIRVKRPDRPAQIRSPAAGPLAVRYIVMAKETRLRRRENAPSGGSTCRSTVARRGPEGEPLHPGCRLVRVARWTCNYRVTVEHRRRETSLDGDDMVSRRHSSKVPMSRLLCRSSRSVQCGQQPVTELIERIILDVFHPEGVPRLWVLGPCADVSRHQLERLMRPVTWIEIGSRVAVAAAAETRKLPFAEHVLQRGQPAARGLRRPAGLGLPLHLTVRPEQRLRFAAHPAVV